MANIYLDSVTLKGVQEKDTFIHMYFSMKILCWTIGVFGFLCNTFVVIVIASSPQMHKLTNAYIINQCSIDAVVAVLLVFTTQFEDNRKNDLKPGRMEDEILCRVWYSEAPLWGMLLSSSYGIVALTYERFFAIIYPVYHNTNIKQNKHLNGLIMVFTWFVGILFNLATDLPSSRVSDNGTCTVCSVYANNGTKLAVGVMVFAAEYAIPLILLGYAYIRMAIVLHKGIKTGIPFTSLPCRSSTSSDIESDNQSRTSDSEASVTVSLQTRRTKNLKLARNNVIKTLALVAFCFVCCWSCNDIYYLMFHLGYQKIDFGGDFYNFTVVLVFASCCINPIIYSLKYRSFQKASIRILTCRRRNHNLPAVY